MKKLFVLFVLVAATSLLNAPNIKGIGPGGQVVQLGYFTGYAIGSGGSYNINVSTTVYQEGTFTCSGNFGNYNPTAHFFTSSQTVGNWTVTFEKVDFIYYGYNYYTSYNCTEYYTELFKPNNTYRITYTVTSSSNE